MPPAFVLIGIAVVLLVAVLLVVTWRKERERTEALQRLAETMGLSFQAKAEIESVRSLADVQLFARGHSKKVRNLMTGRLGELQGAVFDYSYTTGSGKNQHTTSQTVVLLPSLKGTLPDMQMAPENPLIRLAERFGYQDIDIDASPEFSRGYLVRGADEAAIRTALYPQATTYFAAHEGWTVEAQSGSVAIYRTNRRPKAEELQAFIAEACAAAQSL